MFDIGWGEVLVIGIVAILASDWADTYRNIREWIVQIHDRWS
jgi:hypothetical protein